jgi:hypothetical protein
LTATITPQNYPFLILRFDTANDVLSPPAGKKWRLMGQAVVGHITGTDTSLVVCTPPIAPAANGILSLVAIDTGIPNGLYFSSRMVEITVGANPYLLDNQPQWKDIIIKSNSGIGLQTIGANGYVQITVEDLDDREGGKK